MKKTSSVQASDASGNLVSLKPHYIYIFKLEGRTAVFEGEFIGSIRGHPIWRHLPFARPQDEVPRFTHFGDIEWAEEVMLMDPSTTESDYNEALKTLPP